MNEEYYDTQKTGGMIMYEIYDWIESGITAVVCVILIFTFVGRLVGVEGESMIPTLNDKDRLVATSLLYEPSNGDIVVVTKPNIRNEPLIKRVIATGGQILDIDFEKNAVYVDGNRVDEPYIFEPMYPDSDCALAFPLKIPEGYVFIMGDNRNSSWDSRAGQIGLVDERHILGKIVYRVMPYNEIGVPK